MLPIFPVPVPLSSARIGLNGPLSGAILATASENALMASSAFVHNARIVSCRRVPLHACRAVVKDHGLVFRVFGFGFRGGGKYENSQNY